MTALGLVAAQLSAGAHQIQQSSPQIQPSSPRKAGIQYSRARGGSAILGRPIKSGDDGSCCGDPGCARVAAIRAMPDDGYLPDGRGVDACCGIVTSWTHDYDKTRPDWTEMSAAGAEDAQGAEVREAGGSAGSALHRSLVGDRYSAPEPGNRRSGRNYRTRRAQDRIPDRKGRRTVCVCGEVAGGKSGQLNAPSCIQNG